ncbi:ATP synthase F1 subunit delta [Loigolactobacillus jiayinensis]|mgnify:CR=1 FL=1|uniref:ATP synthase subunit delta n=1 Tax=Loigolactobacillus jiayinensis TaxID=2486016 RepID=A0ABW1RJC5_9LACO|nr:ATP synthase F1 subunit delta [Loigolactobacillus jiayinensis]
MALDKYTIGQRYGTALFDLATEQETVDNVYVDVMALQQVFADAPTLASVLTNATLTLDQKQPILASLQQGASASVKNLIQMVFDYGRMNEMPFILAAFVQRYDQVNGIIHAKVTSAVTLSDTQQTALATQLATRFGAKKVTIDNAVDATVIGGVIVEANNMVIDGSIRSKLAQVRQLLLG